MSIDLKTETIIDLKQAPPYLGRSRNGRPVHYSYLVRAIRKGINGHRLEALRIGNRWITSVEALQRWAEIQTLVPLAANEDRKSYAAPAKGPTSSIVHLAMTFATDFEVQLNG
jgi:hypothetical protein